MTIVPGNREPHNDGYNNPPEYMQHDEKSRIHQAVYTGTRLYPGPVGELVARELLVWVEMGHRVDQSGLLPRLVEHILNPGEAAA